MFVHSSRFQKQFEYLASLGIDTSPIHKQTGIGAQEIFDPNKTFDFELYKEVLDFALRQTQNPNYGLDFGNQAQIGGTIGTMCATCKNLKEAFIQGCKFLKLQGDFAELSFVDDDAFPKLVYKTVESWTLENPMTAKLEVDAMFSFLNLILKLNSNDTLRIKKLNLKFEKPESIEKYIDVFGIEPSFSAKANEMIFKNSSLMIPMKAFNPETYKLLNSYLQSQLDNLSSEETTSQKVKKILHSSFKYQFPDIETVAAGLNLGSRTLQRKLSEENTSFKKLLQEVRFGIAKKLLQQKGFTISEISFTLGYSDLGNFSRSFKKFTGKSPQEFRESVQ